MRLSRRVVLGRFAALAALPLLAACQAESAAPQATALALAPLPTATPEATATVAAEPTVAPTLAPQPTLEPTRVAAPQAMGRPMYQMDPQHTGRSPNRGPRDPKLMRSFNTGNFQVKDGAIPQADIQSSAAIDGDGTIYLANHQGVLFALRDPRTGPNGGT